MKRPKRPNIFSGFQITVTLVAVALILGTTGCSEEEPVVEIDEDTVEMEAFADADFDEIDDLVSVGMIAAELPSEPGARIAGDIDDERFTCAEVTFNRENKTSTVNSGDECEGPRGRIRSRIIRITYSGFWFRHGSVITTTLENFALDGRKIEGTRTVTNVSESIESAPTHRITLTGGKITFLMEQRQQGKLSRHEDGSGMKTH